MTSPKLFHIKPATHCQDEKQCLSLVLKLWQWEMWWCIWSSVLYTMIRLFFKLIHTRQTLCYDIVTYLSADDGRKQLCERSWMMAAMWHICRWLQHQRDRPAIPALCTGRAAPSPLLWPSTPSVRSNRRYWITIRSLRIISPLDLAITNRRPCYTAPNVRRRRSALPTNIRGMRSLCRRVVSRRSLVQHRYHCPVKSHVDSRWPWPAMNLKNWQPQHWWACHCSFVLHALLSRLLGNLWLKYTQ